MKNSSQNTSRKIAKTVIHIITKTTPVIFTRLSLCKSEVIDFRKQLNIITKDFKAKKGSFATGFISKCKSWKEMTSDKWILQTVSRGASMELEDLAIILLSTDQNTERLYYDSEKMLFRKKNQ